MVRYPVFFPNIGVIFIAGFLSWMPHLFFAENSCPPPDFPEGGVYTPQIAEYETGMSVSYFCIHNQARPTFYKNGAWSSEYRNAICESSGKWSEPTIFCIIETRLTTMIAPSKDISRDFFPIDSNLNTCYGPVKDKDILQFSLGAKLIPYSVILCCTEESRGKIEVRFTPTWNLTYDTDLAGNVAYHCIILPIQGSPSKTKTVTVEISSKINSSVSLCEISIFARDEKWCFEPPESVPNGQLEVSPTKAVLHCNEDFREKDGKTVYATCRENKWLYHSLECVAESQENRTISGAESQKYSKISAFAGGFAVAILIVIIIGVTLFFISRKKYLGISIKLKRFDNGSRSTSSSVCGQTIKSSEVENSNFI